MIGWAFKKGIQSATGARDAPTTGAGAEDTTQFEAPDTPAPIFAARAIKHAIFGTPAPPREPSPERRRVASTTDAADATSKNQSPVKPAGILLTPGTGTARRKRVSFGHDVKAGTNGDTSPLTTKTSQPKKTHLQQALENARSSKSKKAAAPSEAKPAAEVKKAPAEVLTTDENEEELDGEWDDDGCDPDVTVDLNFPHSESGKYWKSTFWTYHDDAKAEMEKLVKYKYLAKRYAEKKDAEAVNLSEKLKEEQEKVVQLERKITEMAAQMADKPKRGVDTGNDSDLMKLLAEKTALTVEYRDRVNELEVLLKAKDGSGSGLGKSHNYHINTPPATAQTLLEVNRELRRARKDLKEMKSLQQQVERLKTDLRSAQEKAMKLEEQNKSLTSDATQLSLVQKLEKEIRDLKNESRRKDDELTKLKNDYTVLKLNAKTRYSESMQVVQEKNKKIASLEKEINDLKTRDTLSSRPKTLDAAISAHQKATRGLKSDIESMNMRAINMGTMSRQPHKRSASADDLTFDLSQHGFLEDISNQNRSTGSKETLPVRPSSADWTSSLEIEEQLRRDKKERTDARNRDREMYTEELDGIDRDREVFTEEFDMGTPTPIRQTSRDLYASKATQRSSGRGRISSVLSDRVNESSPKDSHHKNDKGNSAGSRASRGNQDLMHGALDKTTTTRNGSRSHSNRPLSPGGEEPAIDLLQGRFARLGGPDVNNTLVAANASRCTLPADRQAAARARLEKKRRERQSGSNRGHGKENVRP